MAGGRKRRRRRKSSRGGTKARGHPLYTLYSLIMMLFYSPLDVQLSIALSAVTALFVIFDTSGPVTGSAVGAGLRCQTSIVKTLEDVV